jgi:uncharacterized damage-inducible protein DinB
MTFELDKTIEILQRTPLAISALLNGTSQEWTSKNEGAETWSPFDVIGHLVHCEKTSWINRIEIILSENEDKSFPPVDRFAQFNTSKGKSLDQLLEEFIALRKINIQKLKELNLNETHFSQTGTHPSFGSVTLSQLLSTWMVHDLDHLAQISRVMAKQYLTEVGPWIGNLKLLRQQ